MIYICVPTTRERAERLEVLKESLRKYAGIPYVLCTYENYREGFIQPIKKILNGLAPHTLVWCIGDDTELTEPDTLKRLALEFYNRFPHFDGIVQPNDGIQEGRIITMPLCTARTMMFGQHDGYFLNYADVEFTMIAEAFGKYKYCPDINVQHSHWVNRKAKMDDTYSFAASKDQEDAKLFQERVKLGFKDNNLYKQYEQNS